MLRHALPSVAWTRRLVSHPSLRRAVATSAEKRALNVNQLKGAETEKAPTPPTPPPPAQGGDSSLPLILGGLALVGVGVAAYSSGAIPGLQSHPEEAAPKATAKEKGKKAATVVVAAVDDAKVEKEPASVAKETATSAPVEPAGNRVVTISLPKGSRQSLSPAETSIEHPVGGNRVGMPPKVAQEPVGTPEPSVDAALQELRGQLSQESSITLQEARQELAKLSSLDAKELDALSPTQLKIRIIQLSKDLEDRTKWEAVRLKEFLAMKEQEVQNK
jgi:hypothetical protein